MRESPFPLCSLPTASCSDAFVARQARQSLGTARRADMQRRTFSAALGFKVREAPKLCARYGHLAGSDRQRADDVNAMFADPGVQGLLAMSGGAGTLRFLAVA